MTEETTTETVSNETEKPFETNSLSAYSPLEHEETALPKSQEVSKKPFETGVFNHGTGKVTFTQALQLITASKATLSRYTNDGKLSFETNEEGHKIYQVAELERVFGKLKVPETKETVTEEVSSNHLKQPEPDSETALELAILREKLSHAEELKQLYKQQAENAQREAQQWQQQAERATLMLTHQPTTAAPVEAPQPVSEPKPEPVPEPKRGFFGRIFGGS